MRYIKSIFFYYLLSHLIIKLIHFFRIKSHLVSLDLVGIIDAFSVGAWQRNVSFARPEISAKCADLVHF